MYKVEYALKLAKDCTYADVMTEGAKEHLRNKINEALKELYEKELNPLASKPFKIQEDSSYKLYNNDNDNINN